MKIRDLYTESSVAEYYDAVRSGKEQYYNPHTEGISQALDYVSSIIDIKTIFDIGCGNGTVTKFLNKPAIGIDKYMSDIYHEKTGYTCIDISMEDFSLSDISFKTSICIASYSYHLIDKTYISNFLYKISDISEYFLILAPNKNILVPFYFELIDMKKFDKTYFFLFKKI